MKRIIALATLIFGISLASYGYMGYWCSVSKTCSSGGQVRCEGMNECSRGTDSVTCDGKTTKCASGSGNEEASLG